LPSTVKLLFAYWPLTKAADVNTFVLLFSVPKLKEANLALFTEVEKP
jgi:hypothetical protein